MFRYYCFSDNIKPQGKRIKTFLIECLKWQIGAQITLIKQILFLCILSASAFQWQFVFSASLRLNCISAKGSSLYSQCLSVSVAICILCVSAVKFYFRQRQLFVFSVPQRFSGNLYSLRRCG